MLSTSLQACAGRATRPQPAIVAVAVPAALPPAELTACPIAPVGFPGDRIAVMPPEVRSAAIRLAQAYAASANQLARLINWSVPGACPT